MSSPTITVRTPRDIIDYINDHPTGTGRTRLLAIIALGGVFVDAYDFTSLGLGIGSPTKQWSLDPLQVGLLTSVMASVHWWAAFSASTSSRCCWPPSGWPAPWVG